MNNERDETADALLGVAPSNEDCDAMRRLERRINELAAEAERIRSPEPEPAHCYDGPREPSQPDAPAYIEDRDVGDETDEKIGLVCMWCGTRERDMECDDAPTGHHLIVDGDELVSPSDEPETPAPRTLRSDEPIGPGVQKHMPETPAPSEGRLGRREWISRLEIYGTDGDGIGLNDEEVRDLIQALHLASPSGAAAPQQCPVQSMGGLRCTLDESHEGEHTALRATVAAPRGADATASLVRGFADAVLAKLREAEAKYGYTTHWRDSADLDGMRRELREHVEKGDPRDVAAYCAFLWYHGETTASPSGERERETGHDLDLAAVRLAVTELEAVQRHDGHAPSTEHVLKALRQALDAHPGDGPRETSGGSERAPLVAALSALELQVIRHAYVVSYGRTEADVGDSQKRLDAARAAVYEAARLTSPSGERESALRKALEEIAVHPNALFNVRGVPRGAQTIRGIARRALDDHKEPKS